MQPLDIGKFAEDIAEKYFKNIGYEILARNKRFRCGEIDLILRKNGILVFCEVKSRNETSYIAPEEALDFQKRRKLLRAIRRYCIESCVNGPAFFDVPDLNWQLDLFCVTWAQDGRDGQPRKVKKATHYKNVLGEQ